MENNTEKPICEACGKPVGETYARSGEYRKHHIKCRKKVGRIRERRAREELERRLDDAMADARNKGLDMIDEWRRQIGWRNESAPDHDRELVAAMYWSVRRMVQLMNLEPLVLGQWEDERVIRLARSIGRDAMDRLADIVMWIGPTPWRRDPEMSRTGTLSRPLAGVWPKPARDHETEYRADLDHEQNATVVTMDRIIDRIWDEDNKTDSDGREPERGPWQLTSRAWRKSCP